MSRVQRKKDKRGKDQRDEPVHAWWGRPCLVFEIGLIVLALGIRLIYLLQVHDNPLFYNPTMDPGFHLNWAKDIISGNFWGTEVYFRAPVYPYLLALFYAITGGDLFWVRFFQHVIGACSVWGIYRLARSTVSEGTAKIAGLAAAGYATIIYFENELLLDFLLIPWMLLLVFALLRAYRTREIRWIFAAGLAVGLFAITRPNILLCLPILGFWVLRWCPGRPGLWPQTKRVLLLGLGTLLPILPVTVRNAVVGADFVLISAQGGVNFYIGNNEEADGLSAAMPQPWGHTWHLAEIEKYAEDKMGRDLKPSEVSSFWLKKGISWWIDHPASALKLTFKKAVLLFSNTEIANNQNIRYFWNSNVPLTKFLPLPFGILAPFGLLGLLAAVRGNVRVKLMLWVMLFYALSVIAFFVPARFRLPLLPFLFIGFGVFVERIFNRLRERNTWRVAVLAVPAALLMVLSFGQWYRAQPATDAQSVFQLGNAALRARELDKAEDYFHQTLILHPGYENAHLNLGVVLLRKGLLEQAAEQFQAEIAVHPQSGKAYANLCSVRGLQNRLPEAEQFGKEALRLEPDNPTAILNLSRIWWSTKKFRQAVDLLESAPEEVKTSPAGRDALGGSYLQLRRFADAEEVLRPLARGDIRADPLSAYETGTETYADELGYAAITKHRARANYNLGWMSARQGNPHDAVQFFREAISLNPGFAEGHANLGATYIELNKPDSALESFLAAVQADPNHAGYVYNVGIARLHLGDTIAAIAEFERTLQIEPRFTRAKRKLQTLHKDDDQ